MTDLNQLVVISQTGFPRLAVADVSLHHADGENDVARVSQVAQ